MGCFFQLSQSVQVSPSLSNYLSVLQCFPISQCLILSLLAIILKPFTIVPSHTKYFPFLKSFKVYSSLYNSFKVSQSIKQAPKVNQNDILSVKVTPSLSNYHPVSPSLFHALLVPPSVKSFQLFPRLYQSIIVSPTPTLSIFQCFGLGQSIPFGPSPLHYFTVSQISFNLVNSLQIVLSSSQSFKIFLILSQSLLKSFSVFPSFSTCLQFIQGSPSLSQYLLIFSIFSKLF